MFDIFKINKRLKVLEKKEFLKEFNRFYLETKENFRIFGDNLQINIDVIFSEDNGDVRDVYGNLVNGITLFVMVGNNYKIKKTYINKKDFMNNFDYEEIKKEILLILYRQDLLKIVKKTNNREKEVLFW
jgi:hypothetical protein